MNPHGLRIEKNINFFSGLRGTERAEDRLPDEDEASERNSS
jgi:hypothetical protein